MKLTRGTVLAIILYPLGAAAQVTVSANAAVLSFAEGEVTIGARTIGAGAQSIALEPDQPVATRTGRAEIMLNPCIVLHLDENSGLRIIANRLIDTRVELTSGSALIRADGILRDTDALVTVKDAALSLRYRGLYAMDASPPRLKVFKGKAEVQRLGKPPLTMKSGRMADLTAAASPMKFNADQEGDDFGRWSVARAVKLLFESGFNEAAEQERERRERAWRQAEADGPIRRGTRPPQSSGATQGRLRACADASVR